MPDLDTFIVFAGVSLAVLLFPGPAVIYIVTRGATQGRAAGLVSMLGVEAGNLVHVFAAAVGLSAILASSAEAFTVVKYLGAAYLVYLGVRALLDGEDEQVGGRGGARRSRLFGQGVVIAVLNPKTALFFLAFLPQFVEPGDGAAWLQIATLGTFFVAIAVITDGAYALAAGGVGSLIRGSRRARATLRQASGAVYIALGAGAALSGADSRNGS
jgi:threonine/homoserine/homoserine lactone efflux protein